MRKSLEHNRSLKMMKRIDKAVNWKNIEALLLEHYEVGKSKEGADAYSPLMLLLPAHRVPARREVHAATEMSMTWRAKLGMGSPSGLEAYGPEGIPSDPELENQINDRISFKKFLGLPLDKPSPDHSTLSRFPSRISKEALMELNSEVLREFAQKAEGPH